MENVLNNPTLSYRRQVWCRTAALAAIFGLTLLVGIYAVTQGAYNLSPMQAIRALIGNAGEGADVVVWNIRLPRIIASLVVGWGLALSGLGIQSLLRNPLGSPSTLGISQGAAFGVAAAIVFLHAGIVSVTIFAFMGAMGATMIILILARLKRLSPEAIILSGVALSALFGSATILIQYLATDIQLAAVVFWTFGDVARSGWREIGLLTLVVSLVSVFFVIQRWDLNALDSGEEAARGLGVNVERLRLQGMVAAALIAALATAFHGVIAFVGLIAPHMARRLVGTDHCLLIPFSAVLGALLLLSADTLSVNPDVIFIDAGGLMLVSEDYRKKPEFYNALKAFQTRRVVILHPFNFYTTNIDTALTDAWVVGKILYPDRFKDIDLEKKANKIYTFFVDRPVYEQMKQAFGAIGQTAPFITAKAGG